LGKKRPEALLDIGRISEKTGTVGKRGSVERNRKSGKRKAIWKFLKEEKNEAELALQGLVDVGRQHLSNTTESFQVRRGREREKKKTEKGKPGKR